MTQLLLTTDGITADLDELCQVMNEVYDGDNEDDILEEANLILKGHGVEYMTSSQWISHYYGYTYALYINKGKTYEDTLIFDCEENKFIVSSQGDFCQEKEQKWWKENFNEVVDAFESEKEVFPTTPINVKMVDHTLKIVMKNFEPHFIIDDYEDYGIFDMTKYKEELKNNLGRFPFHEIELA